MDDSDDIGVVMYGVGLMLPHFVDWTGCADELSYNRLIQQMWGVMLFDIDWYIMEHAGLTAQDQLILWSYLSESPLDQPAVEEFLDQHVDLDVLENLLCDALSEHMDKWSVQLGLSPKVARRKLEELELTED